MWSSGGISPEEKKTSAISAGNSAVPPIDRKKRECIAAQNSDRTRGCPLCVKKKKGKRRGVGRAGIASLKLKKVSCPDKGKKKSAGREKKPLTLGGGESGDLFRRKEKGEVLPLNGVMNTSHGWEDLFKEKIGGRPPGRGGRKFSPKRKRGAGKSLTTTTEPSDCEKKKENASDRVRSPIKRGGKEGERNPRGMGDGKRKGHTHLEGRLPRKTRV